MLRLFSFLRSRRVEPARVRMSGESPMDFRAMSSPRGLKKGNLSFFKFCGQLSQVRCICENLSHDFFIIDRFVL